jgi:hypothetical protein
LIFKSFKVQKEKKLGDIFQMKFLLKFPKIESSNPQKMSLDESELLLFKKEKI